MVGSGSWASAWENSRDNLRIPTPTWRSGSTAAVQLTLGLPYDDDHDGQIQLTEAIAAASDYFSGKITIQQAIAVVQLYFASF